MSNCDNEKTLRPASLFSNLIYCKLFAAQVIALSGTGLSTIALALLAHNLAGSNAGVVLGIALALKMVAYVFVAPVVGGIAHRLPRKSLMISMDVFRAGLVLAIPLVSSIWQIYLLIFLINACSAAFKPVYQAIIPDILPNERHYTKALSTFRIAYDTENILSPSIAAILLTFWTFDSLFLINGAAFIVSALLIVMTRIPASEPTDRPENIGRNLLFGLRSYLATPRLRGMLALYFAVAAASSMVIVNTVVYVKSNLGGSDVETAQAMLSVGAGSVAAALLLPRLLVKVSDRRVMIGGAWLLGLVLGIGATEPGYAGLLAMWFVLGIGLSVIQTPSGRLITASCNPGDRTAFFSANFALTHGCWFFGYLLVGFLGTAIGLPLTFVVMACIVVLATLASLLIWPPETDDILDHLHKSKTHRHPHAHDKHHQHEHQPEDQPEIDDAPHIHNHHHSQLRHRHSFVIDFHHPRWPD